VLHHLLLSYPQFLKQFPFQKIQEQVKLKGSIWKEIINNEVKNNEMGAKRTIQMISEKTS
jgi:hypothetical protein